MKTFEPLSIIGSIVAVGITLGAVVIGSNANLRAEVRAEMQALRAEVGAEMQTLRAEVRTDIRAWSSATFASAAARAAASARRVHPCRPPDA